MGKRREREGGDKNVKKRKREIRKEKKTRTKLIWKDNHVMKTNTHLIIDVDPIAEEEEDIEIPFVAAVQVSGENSKKE